MDLGRGEAFRNPAWFERTAAAFSGPLARLPLRTPLKHVYEALLDRLAGDYLVSRFPGGESVRVAAAHRHLTWNPDEYHAFRRDISKGDVVVDIGANVGAYSLLFAQWVQPSGHVYAFEPAPEARRGLERHVVLNHCGGVVSILPNAVASSSRIVRFRANGSQGDNAIVTGTRDGIDVSSTSLDEFCAMHRVTPAFVKIDVEGAELEVLKGARRTIASRGDALRLYVEIHPRAWATFGTSREQFDEELHRQRLRAERIDGGADVWGLEGVCLRLRRCAS